MRLGPRRAKLCGSVRYVLPGFRIQIDYEHEMSMSKEQEWDGPGVELPSWRRQLRMRLASCKALRECALRLAWISRLRKNDRRNLFAPFLFRVAVRRS